MLDQRERDALVLQWTGLVTRELRRGGRRRVDRDLAAAGLLALVEASRSFDPSRGPFGPWALVRVRRAIAAARRAEPMVHVPREIRSAVHRARRELGAAGDAASIAARAGTTLAAVLAVVARPVSLDAPLRADSEAATLGDVIADVHAVDPMASASDAEVRAAVAGLPPLERSVVAAQWLEPVDVALRPTQDLEARGLALLASRLQTSARAGSP